MYKLFIYEEGLLISEEVFVAEDVSNACTYFAAMGYLVEVEKVAA